MAVLPCKCFRSMSAIFLFIVQYQCNYSYDAHAIQCVGVLDIQINASQIPPSFPVQLNTSSYGGFILTTSVVNQPSLSTGQDNQLEHNYLCHIYVMCHFHFMISVYYTKYLCVIADDSKVYKWCECINFF